MDTQMERTQVYLPKALKKELNQIAEYEGSNLSALLRDAGQKLVKEKLKKHRNRDKEFTRLLNDIAGIWAGRDPKEFEENRRSMDRKFPGWND